MISPSFLFFLWILMSLIFVSAASTNVRGKIDNHDGIQRFSKSRQLMKESTSGDPLDCGEKPIDDGGNGIDGGNGSSGIVDNMMMCDSKN